jgi:hypothetical protein
MDFFQGPAFPQIEPKKVSFEVDHGITPIIQKILFSAPPQIVHNQDPMAFCP